MPTDLCVRLEAVVIPEPLGLDEASPSLDQVLLRQVPSIRPWEEWVIRPRLGGQQ